MTEKQEKKQNTELDNLKEEIAKKEATINDYTNHLKRLQAEFENYIKRVEKERSDIISLSSERLVVKILLIIDDFERALKQDMPEETRKGIELIFKNLHKVLDEEKVAPIKAVGQKLDPYKHEVMMQVESEQPEGTILEELQKGYTMNGKVIRYTKVKISNGAKKAGGN